MKIAYLDESFTKGFYFIGALIVSPRDVNAISLAMDELLGFITSDQPGKFLKDDELKGSHIWNGKGQWSEVGDRYRYAVMLHAFRALAKFDIEIALQGIDRRRLENRYINPLPPHELAMKYMLEQLDRRFISRNLNGIVVCDEPGSKTEQNRQRSLLRDWRINGTGGNFPRNLDSISDTLHFVPSHESRLIQAVDMVVYAHQRRMTTRYPVKDESEVMQLLWTIIESKVVVNRTI